MANRFSIKDMGELGYFLGIEVTRTQAGLTLTQIKNTSMIFFTVQTWAWWSLYILTLFLSRSMCWSDGETVPIKAPPSFSRHYSQARLLRSSVSSTELGRSSICLLNSICDYKQLCCYSSSCWVTNDQATNSLKTLRQIFGSFDSVPINWLNHVTHKRPMKIILKDP